MRDFNNLMKRDALKPVFFLLLGIACFRYDLLAQVPTSVRSTEVINRVLPQLETKMIEDGLDFGQPIFIRVFKEEHELELWIEKNESFELFQTYPICYFSGELGPKTRQGDNQSPEGFYFVIPGRMNPWSSFHLSINLGYPNKYDQIHGYTGNYLMIHGSCVSIGCYAMTDPYIEEIYAVAVTAFKHGQKFFRVHVFPFRMTDENLQNHKNEEWFDFWLNLQQGFNWFETKKTPPNVDVMNGEYVFN